MSYDIVFALGTALIIAVVCILTLRDAMWLMRAHRLSVAPELLEHNSLVSVIVPARDEERNIARCLDGLAAQDYPNYEVIVVDDGSTDDTPQILARYAQTHAQWLRVVKGRPLPPGWVGKCNACLHGSEFARGEWLLFLDADTAPQPKLISALVADATARKLDALSIFPFNELGSLSERLVLPVFFMFAWTVFPLEKVTDPNSPPESAMANGQCFLFRTSVYRAMGGHAAVKDKVLEDVEFAHALRRAGYVLGLAFGLAQLRARMYHNFAEVAQGLAKHAWNGRQAGGWRAYWGVARMLITVLLPTALLAMWAFAFVLNPSDSVALLGAVLSAVGCLTSFLLWRQVYRTLYQLPAWLALFTPLGLLIYLFIVASGSAAMLFRRGVVWKGRSYG